MRRLKPYIKIMFLFALLLGVVSLPAFFMEYRREDSFNEVVLYPVDAVQFGGTKDSSHARNGTLWDRIQLMKGAGVVAQTEAYTDFADAGLQAYLLSAMEQQLVLLQKLNALPVLPFSEAEQVRVSRATYMDRYAKDAAFGQTADTWIIEAKYRDFYVYALMDVETEALLDIALDGGYFPVDSGLSEDGFFEYLLMFSDAPGDGEVHFSVSGYYTPQKIWLNITSDGLPMNKQTG